MMNTAVHVIPYAREHRNTLNDMLFFSDYAHVHLDWSNIETWVHSDHALMFTALHHQRMIGFMGASRPIMGKTWIRVAVFKDHTSVILAFDALWENIRNHLLSLGTTDVYWTVFDDWLKIYVERLGMKQVDEVVTFVRYQAPITMPSTHYTIQSATMNDVDILFEIDRQAFSPMWQMTYDDMRHARRTAAVCTMARDGDQVVGFQLSTIHHYNGHLARLAVLPHMQGKGVGSTLVSDLVRHFNRRRLDYVSVNTQLSNPTSHHLYTKLGFVRNGYDMPIWGIQLQQS